MTFDACQLDQVVEPLAKCAGNGASATRWSRRQKPKLGANKFFAFFL
jgi:hypothetical protein